LVEDPLSEKILWKEFTAGQKVVVNTEPDPDDPRLTKIVFIPEPGPVVPEPPVGVGAGSTESESS
ncbi:MAG: hypothetical protein ACRDI1_09700, partial [Actinomycetota bacterium]